MTDGGRVEIRIAASDADRLAALAVAHDANASKVPLEAYFAARLMHPPRRRATWWLLTDDGAPAASLVSYPLALRNDGVPILGYGLGAVATATAFRRRGHASRLCTRAGDHAAEHGAEVGVLFSAIPPALYERLGFRVVPAHGAVCSDVAGLAGSGPRATLHPFDPLTRIDALVAAFRAVDDGLRASRDADAWRCSIAEGPRHLYFAVDGDGGYARIDREPDAIEVVELVAGDPAPVWRAVAALAARWGIGSVLGWHAPPAELAAWFAPTDRAHTLPMVRGPAEVTTAWLSSADYF